MNEPKAIRSGFQAVLQHPLAFVAELACHWAASIAAGAIALYALFSFLHSLPVSDEDAFLLRGMLPGYTSEAIQHILKGSGPRLVVLLLIVSISAGVMHWLATSAGRSAVLPSLLGGFCNTPYREDKLIASYGTTAVLCRLQALRVSLTFTTVLADLGVLALAEANSRVPVIDLHETRGAYTHDPRVFFGVLFVFGGIVLLASSVLDWYLELSPVLAVMRRSGVRDSFRDAAAIAQRRARQFSTISLVHGALRILLNAAIAIVLFASLNLLVQLPFQLRWTTILFVLGIWSSVQRFLGLSRIAAWGRVIMWDDEYNSYVPPAVTKKKLEIGMPHPLLEPPVAPAM